MPNDAVRPAARRLPRALAAVFLAAAMGAACDNGPELTQTLQLSAPSTNLLVGQTAQISAVMTSKSGKTLTDRPIQYQSSAPAIVSVSAAGLATALGPGSSVISAISDGASASISFIVAPVPISRISISRDTATIAAATTLQLTATALDSAGHVLSGRTINWATADTAVATVNSSGLVSGIAPGTAIIAASSEGKLATMRLTVTPAAIASIDVTPSTTTITEGTTTQFRATAKDAAGHVLTGRKLTWTSSDASVATIDSTGLARAIAPGATNIMVTGGNVFGGAALIVRAVVVGSVTLSPDSAALAVQDTIRFTATVKDTAGKVVNKAVTWATVDATIATVNSSGLVTAVGAGTTSIIASVAGHADTVSVRVSTLPLNSITLVPSPATLALSFTGRFGVVLKDTRNVVVTGVPLRWTSSNPAIVTVDSTGLVSAVGIGTATIFASGGGTFTGATVYAVGNSIFTLTANVSALALNTGQSRQILVVAKDGFDTVMTGRMISFRSSNPAVATVDAYGNVTAVSAGTATITITCESQVVTVAVTVS